MNHVVLPVSRSGGKTLEQDNIYHWLSLIKRTLVIILMLTAYGFYHMLGNQPDLDDFGIVACAGAIQLLPATLATLYWPEINRTGFIAGLAAGVFLWFFSLMLPLSMGLGIFPPGSLYPDNLAVDNWHIVASCSLTINVLLMLLVSRWSSMRPEEFSAAWACQVVPEGLQNQAEQLDDLRRYHRQTLYNLPMALCAVDTSVSGNSDIMLWNQAMADITGISSEQVTGTPISHIPAPWGPLLCDFVFLGSTT